MAAARILVVDDEPAIRRAIARSLAPLGAEMVEAEDGVDAMGKLGQGFDVVLTDLRMPRADGLTLLRAVRQRSPRTAVVVLTGTGTVNDCVEAMRAGAVDFMSKPFDSTQLREVIERAIGESASTTVTERLPAVEDAPRASLVGESTAIKDVIATVERIAESDATVLLSGESGTGKEVVAHLIHASSGRAGRRFVAVNCGAIPEGLVESELFGHAKGSFTGATEKRTGRFVDADGGTIFLDEIGELAPAMQVRLLRVLQEREVQPVGESRSVRVDIRVIAATNRDLEQMAAQGAFREDLFYRLNVVPIALPSLRERDGDIEVLARHFLERAGQHHRATPTFSPAALDAFRSYAWPGNVRELQNVIERLVLLDKDGVIDTDDLPAKMKPGATAVEAVVGKTTLPDGGINLVETLATIERQLIDEAMRRTNGNKTHAADLLGLNRTTLLEKLKRTGRA